MPSQLASELTLFVIYILLICLISTASAVFLGLSVYNDARYRCNGNAVMWGLLSGFFGIAAIIYLCIRSSEKYLTCLRCRQTYPSDSPCCPVCGLPSPNVSRIGTPQQMKQWKKRRKLFLILFIVSIALTVIASAAVFVWYFNSILRMVESSQYYF